MLWPHLIVRHSFNEVINEVINSRVLFHKCFTCSGDVDAVIVVCDLCSSAVSVERDYT